MSALYFKICGLRMYFLFHRENAKYIVVCNFIDKYKRHVKVSYCESLVIDPSSREVMFSLSPRSPMRVRGKRSGSGIIGWIFSSRLSKSCVAI